MLGIRQLSGALKERSTREVMPNSSEMLPKKWMFPKDFGQPSKLVLRRSYLPLTPAYFRARSNTRSMSMHVSAARSGFSSGTVEQLHGKKLYTGHVPV